MSKSKSYQSLLQIMNAEQPIQAPAAIWNTRGSVGFPEGVTKIKDYYDNPELKVKTQLFPLGVFDDITLIPGVWPDFGVALEASAFGCEVTFRDNNPPVALPFMKSIEDSKKLEPINPEKDGLMATALEQYKVMLEKLPKEALEKIPYLDGCSLTTGPLEVASMILGHTEFYMAFNLYPDLAKELLELVTEGIIDYLKALEKISGKIKLLSMIEHTPGQISVKHFEEFGKPYISRIFNTFPEAIRVYHNEDNVSHIADQLHEIGADIYHFGDIGDQSVKEFKARLKGDTILMGNVHPLRTLLNGIPEDVRKESEACVEAAKPRIILCSGGGLTSGTPRENLRTMIEVAHSAYK